MVSLKRRSSQINQLLFSSNITDNKKNQESIKNRYSTPEEVSYYKKIALSGFTPSEEKTIQNLIQVYPRNSQVLCIGGGCGREAFAFHKLGFQTTSLDASEKMTRVGREIGQQINASIDFQHGNFLHWTPQQPFQIIFLSSILINFIQGSKNRVAAIKKIHSLLDENGIFVFETDVFSSHPLSRYSLCSLILKLRFGKKWEKGDTVRSFFGPHSKDRNLISYHHYLDEEEVYNELKSAGFMSLGHSSELFWGFKK